MIMAKIEPFEKHASEYDEWFEKNRFVYKSELRAVQEQLPQKGEGIEVGVGSGRFAAPLGILSGLDPSGRMRALAQRKGITAVDGLAEKLPYEDCRFRFVLMVTTICFLDDIESAFKEAYRVIKPDGHLIIGLIDRNSPVGMLYQQHRDESKFYNMATFYSVDEVVSHLKKTIFQSLKRIKNIEPIKKGYGEGSFVVVKALRPKEEDRYRFI